MHLISIQAIAGAEMMNGGDGLILQSLAALKVSLFLGQLLQKGFDQRRQGCILLGRSDSSTTI